MFELGFADGWDTHYRKMDSTEQKKIWKKILQLKTLSKARHMQQGLPCFVVEAGQYRICFKEEASQRAIHFAGNHRQYQKWYKQFYLTPHSSFLNIKTL